MALEAVEMLMNLENSLIRATVMEFSETGEILIQTDSEPSACVLCDYLVTTPGPQLLLSTGDPVLVLLPTSEGGKGCVLGKIGVYKKPKPTEEPVPEHVLVEARKELTLRCGQGKVTLRHDGKILVKGQDVVSHARRSQRIKGGSVSIN